MKKAIVVGANGYIGKNVVKELLKNNIEVLAVSRQPEKLFFNNFSNGENLAYIELDLNVINLLPQKIEEKKWIVGRECVFYNFSWSGSEKLMDGTIEEQLLNVVYLSNSIKVASEIGCCKFIDSGSIEETFAEKYLVQSWGRVGFSTKNGNYAVSKIASKDMCNLLGYLNKINYIHTRFSAVVDCELKSSGYITSVLKSIYVGQKEYEMPTNQNLFDIIDLDDLANAYYLLGNYGKNKVDYFIGSGQPQKLNDYFDLFKKSISREEIQFINNYDNSIFNNEMLKQDTGLDLKNSYINLINKINSK